jgi:cytoskeletal protein CcmA (bactofilin family)
MSATVWTSVAKGSLTGDVTARRITIGEGAFFKGAIDIRKADQEKNRWSLSKIPATKRKRLTPLFRFNKAP